MAENEQGFNPNRYQVIPRTLIFIFDGEKVLLLKGGADKKIWPGLYNGLGGHIEPGEDVLAAACRELREESGIALSRLDLCGLITIHLQAGNGVQVFVFRGEYRGEPLQESGEGELEWVEMERLGEKPVVEDLKTILPLVCSYSRGKDLFYARYHFDPDGRLVITINQPD